MTEFLQPPPATNFSVPPPSVQQQQMHTSPSQPNQSPSAPHYQNYQRERHYHGGFSGKSSHFRSYNNFRGPNNMSQDDFDGKRLRKSVMRKTVDYNSSIVRELENRIWQRDYRDRRALQPESIYVSEMLPPPSYMDNPINAVTTRFVKTATNKMRCPIFTLAWTPEGRRLVTGASSGEFTLWNGLTFNFETILQAHDVPVRTMVWSHNDNWMVTGDHAGYVKYWQSNMNNVRMFQAHKEPVRGISFSPSDNKFATCSDDGTLRVWDFLRCQEERVLRGHGADVKCVHWHPQKALIVSGSKDNQQPIKLWDPKSGQALATLHAHKSTVMDLKWNDNGNWLVTASRDHLLKLFDLRNLREEVQVFRGHKKEASAVSWHPTHEGLFSSGGSDGSILFWNVGTDKEVGSIDMAHDSIVWTLAWHPLGHILCSGSNDHTIKFWTRNRPGDQMRDKYNLNTLPASLQGLEECEIDEHNITIPGMGLEDKIDFTESLMADKGFIPGLDLDTSNLAENKRDKDKKVPYSKPIPRNFQAQWNDTGLTNDDASKEIKDVINQINENKTGGIVLPKPVPTAIVVYGKMVEVKPGSKLEQVIADGAEALNAYIDSGQVGELSDLIPTDRSDDSNDEDENDLNEPKEKRSKTIRNHNAQVIHKSQDANTMIPSLMTLNVPNVAEPESPWSHPPPTENWNMLPMFNANAPPSLMNLNVAPPFEDSAGNWQQGRADFNNRPNIKPDVTKRRNRDSDGNRISRFDRERPSRFDNNNDNARNNQRRNNRRI